MSYTPGAWKYIPWHIAEDQPQVLDGDGNMICYTASDDNARLIAAAPDLLVALKRLAHRARTMEIYIGPQDEAEDEDAVHAFFKSIDLAIETIARAEGK